jgi:hypothetical protein
MATPLNDFATKAYSEHPIAIWPLDDDVSYISLIETNDNRKLTNWFATKGTTYDNDPTYKPLDPLPFEGGEYSSWKINSSTTEAVSISSPDMFHTDQLNTELKSFSINFYLYQESVLVDRYEIGYLKNSVWNLIKTIEAPQYSSWIRFSVNEIPAAYDAETMEIQLIIYLAAPTSGSVDHVFTMNGLSIGQWSETTSAVSLGTLASTLPPPVDDYTGVPAEQYGVMSDNAYYISESGKLLAINDSIPMVFGSSNVTKLSPSALGSPSFIFPGRGMLYETGRYSDFSLEFWLRIKPRTLTYERIVGPLDSDYGIYVSESSISLVIGNSVKSHPISEWYRPMLVHIQSKGTVTALMINGEVVAEITVDRSTIALPTLLEKDWWGFFSYADIDVFEIDCISIYPYAVPDLVAKKRFVWGQGVDSEKVIDSYFAGDTATVAYSYANYATNKIYPDRERWDAGYAENLSATPNHIEFPDYKLPIINLGGRDLQEWYDDNLKVNNMEYPDGTHPKFITFRPNEDPNTPTWNANGTNWTEQAYLNFSSINMLNNQVSAIYGIFEPFDLDPETQVLMSFVNNTSNKSFDIIVIDDELHYFMNGVDLETLGVPTMILSLDTHFVAGINIPVLSQLSYEISEFFSNPQLIQLYVGGNGVSTFEGKIYRVGFSYQDNFLEISDNFDAYGIAYYDREDLMTQHYASYTLVPTYKYGRFFLDIAASGQWEEFFPLSYFAKQVLDESGNSSYKLGAIQINFDSPITYSEETVTIQNNPAYTYGTIDYEYGYPTARTYADIDADFAGQPYSAIDGDSSSVVQLTPSAYLQPNLTFQLLSEGADEPLSSFIYERKLTDSFVIDADYTATGTDTYEMYKTKFGFLDNTIVYPPTLIDFNQVAMVLNFKVACDGILSSPFRMRKLELSSFVQEDTSFAKIGTKFGNDIVPYVKNNLYYDKKIKNPISIYKSNTPYLYLTEKSGVKLLTDSSTNMEYGMLIPVNKDKTANYSVGIVDMWMKYDPQTIPLTDTPIFEIDYDQGTIRFFVLDDCTGRGIIYPTGGTLATETVFYQNGIPVENPIIEPNEWNVISILFPNALTFNGYAGSIRLFSDTVFKSVSAYQPAGLGESFALEYRPWQYVLNSDPTNPSPPANNLWSDWNGILGTTWQDVLVVSATGSFVTTSKEIYETYIGINRSVIQDTDGISIYNDDVNIYSDITWYTAEYIPS